MPRLRSVSAALALPLLLLAAPAAFAEAPAIQSMSVLEFGADGTLYVGDGKAGAVWALELPERPAVAHEERFAVQDVEGLLAAALGTTPDKVTIHDLAVDPRSEDMLLAVSRDRDPWSSAWLLPNDLADARILMRIDREGTVEEVDLGDVAFTKAELSDPVDPAKTHRWKDGVSLRADTITDLAVHGGELWVAGLSNEEFASALWRIPVPFGEAGSKTTLEVYHGAHGEFETHAPIRTFLPYRFGEEDHLLAAYLCTPFVDFETEDLVDGAHVKGRTLAEFGSGNYPLDMVVVKRGDRDRIVIANSNLPLLVLEAEDIATYAGTILDKVRTYTAGLEATYRSGMGVQHLATLNDKYLVGVQRTPSGTMDLVSLDVRRF